MAQSRQPTAERRRQIADAALEILGTAGVHHLTTAEIARKVGITDGTIFRHFRDKPEIIRAAIDRVSDLLFEDFPPEDPDPLQRLGRFFVDRVRLVRRHPAILKVALSDRLAEAAGKTGERVVRKLQERARGFVRDCLAEAQQAGLLGADLSVEVLTSAVVGALRATAVGELPRGTDPAEVWKTLELTLRRSAR